ncbi:MAG TPA: hypothetical protein VMW73_02340 [Spirochaetia bacterium]|nr:hypothetical protein [Spirochaetia bacterium]
MKSVVLLTMLLLSASTATVLADTVMVSVDATPAGTIATASDNSAALAKAADTLREALEQGIMEQFFNAGHIIFNGPPAPTTDIHSVSLRQQSARVGGASRLILVELAYRSEPALKKTLPVSASYTLWRLDTRQIVESGTVTADSLAHATKIDENQLCLLMGQTIATVLLNKW